MVKYRFEDDIKELFSDISGYHENKRAKTVTFTVVDGFNAESLFKLSALLGTATIYSSPQVKQSWGGCPTCGNDLTKYIEIDATEVIF